MKRIGKALRCQKGMTLVEVIVSILLFAIISTTAAAALSPTVTAYRNANTLAEMNTLLDNLSEELLSDIGNAREITISADEINIKADATTLTYGVNDAGLLYRGSETTLVLPERYYKRKTMTIFFLNADEENELNGTYAQGSNLAFRVKLVIRNVDGSELVSRCYAAKPLGLNQYQP